MDDYIIFEFQTENSAQDCLSYINGKIADLLSAQGYTVVDIDGNEQLVGKNAATGLDEPNSPRMETWDVIQKSPANTWYFSGLSNDTRFQNIGNDLGGFSFIEKAFPQEWVEDDTGI